MQASPTVHREQGDALRTSPQRRRALDTFKTAPQSPKIGRRSFFFWGDHPTERRPGFGAPGIVSQWFVMQPSPSVHREQGDALRTSPDSHRVLDMVKTALQTPKIGRP
jgi:hypothetical protein